MSEAAHPAMAKTVPPTAAGKRQTGIAYLALLIVIAAMGAALAATGSLWHEVQQREKERELLFVGTQYRRAIKQYYESLQTQKKYPPTLEALLLDERTPAIRRYLRQPYRDPMRHPKESKDAMESKQWGLVLAPQGGIMGVYSLAEGRPFRQANFPAELGWDNDKASYRDWQFIYVPNDNKAGSKRP